MGSTQQKEPTYTTKKPSTSIFSSMPKLYPTPSPVCEGAALRMSGMGWYGSLSTNPLHFNIVNRIPAGDTELCLRLY